MAGPYIPGRQTRQILTAGQSILATTVTLHSEMGGGAPKDQGSQGRMTSGDRSCNCGPIGQYPGSKETEMVKSPSHWEKPASDKGSAALEQKQLRPGKSDLPTPRDSDWHKAAKESGVGFSGNPTAVLVRGDNPAAQAYRSPPEHKYRVTDYGAATGPARVELQNRLATKRK